MNYRNELNRKSVLYVRYEGCPKAGLEEFLRMADGLRIKVLDRTGYNNQTKDDVENNDVILMDRVLDGRYYPSTWSAFFDAYIKIGEDKVWCNESLYTGYGVLDEFMEAFREVKGAE